MPLKERIQQSDLMLYEILRNPSTCGEFINNYDKLDYEEPFELTWYQREMLLDFNQYVSFCCGRSVGKTLVLSNLIVWILINNIFPNDYIVYTVPGKAHLEPVFTNLVRLFRTNSFLKQLISPHSGVNNSDFTVLLTNQAKLLCRIAGQTGTGIAVIGLHSPFEILDEGGYYPHSTFIEFQPTLNNWTQGSRRMVSGVPTGVRENNVLYYADQQDSNYSKHRISALQNPRFTEEDKQNAITQYGGEDSDDYDHLVLGVHGKPVFALFDRGMMEVSNYPVYKMELEGRTFGDNINQYFEKLSLLPAISNKDFHCFFGVDLGFCYSSDTDVLTKRGWIKHENIDLDDLIACYDTVKNEIVWDHPLYVWEQDYKGKMLEVSGKSTNFMVSPEHSVWISKEKSGIKQPFGRMKAKELSNLKNNRFSVKIATNPEILRGLETFTVPYYYCKRKDREPRELTVPMDVWVEFLGWFISEGSTTSKHGWEISLTQSVGEYEKMIDSVLNKLPYTVTKRVYINPWNKEQVVWRLTCKELCLWLIENCGKGSRNKKIPEFIFDLSVDNRELFLRTLLYGDGSRVHSSRSPQYNTQSETLIDQVQRLALSLGYSSTKGFYPGTGGMYRCTIMKRQENELYRNRSIKEIDYEGKIYCLKTTTGFYITRRKGRVAIQGNTEPTACWIMYTDGLNRIKFHAKIRLNKVSYPIQEKIIDYLDSKFDPDFIGMDEGNAGKPVRQHLMEDVAYSNKDYKERIHQVDFSSNIVLGIDTEGKEIKEDTKPFSTSVLQEWSNNHKIVYTSTDLEMITELERMTWTKTPSGKIIYRTLTEKGGKKGEDHFTSALLCGIMAYYLIFESLTRERKVELFKGGWIIT